MRAMCLDKRSAFQVKKTVPPVIRRERVSPKKPYTSYGKITWKEADHDINIPREPERKARARSSMLSDAYSDLYACTSVCVYSGGFVYSSSKYRNDRA